MKLSNSQIYRRLPSQSTTLFLVLHAMKTLVANQMSHPNLMRDISSTHSSVVHQIVLLTPQHLLLQKHLPRHTTRSLSTVIQDLERPTSCTQLVHMQKSYMAMSVCVMYPLKNLPTTLLTRSVMIKRLLFSVVTATSISCSSTIFNS